MCLALSDIAVEVIPHSLCLGTIFEVFRISAGIGADILCSARAEERLLHAWGVAGVSVNYRFVDALLFEKVER